MISVGVHHPDNSSTSWHQSMSEPSLDFDRVDEAAAAIPEVFLSSPQYRSSGLSRALGLEVIVKIEAFNPVGSAAGRSAEWWFECHPDLHRVVCASAGDFGVAMAHAGRVRGIEVDLFGPLNADCITVDDLRRSGTTVQLDGGDQAEATEEARRYASVVDAQFIHDGDHVEFVEGAATLAAELTGHALDAQSIFVASDTPFLSIGIGLWLHQRAPRTGVVSVVVGSGRGDVDHPSIDQIVHVNAKEIAEAQRALMRFEALSASPTGAAPLAAAMADRDIIRGSKVVVVVGSRALA